MAIDSKKVNKIRKEKVSKILYGAQCQPKAESEAFVPQLSKPATRVN